MSTTPPPLTDQQHAAIRAREAAATPGPWFNDGHEIYVGTPDDYTSDSVWIGETCNIDLPDRGDANGAFLAHARQDVPALLAEVDRLRAEQIGAGARDLVNARVGLMMFRQALGSAMGQISETIQQIGHGTAPLRQAESRASDYRARWVSTVVEARRQHAEAARLRAERDQARAQLAEARSTWRRLKVGLIANADLLDVPFSNAPSQSPWKRLKPALLVLDSTLNPKPKES